MLGIIGVVAAAAGIFWLEAPALFRKKRIRELLAFCGLLLFGTAVSVARVGNAPVPNPLDWIAAVYKPVTDVIFSYFK